MMDYNERLKVAVQKNDTIAGVLRSLGKPVKGHYYKHIKEKISRLGLDTSHFLGHRHLTGKNRIFSGITPLKNILIENSGYKAFYTLKKRLIRNKLLEYKCYICGIVKWNDKELTLQLDHINGKSRDNRIENLRLLCPNCHSQTRHYAGRNSIRANTKKKWYCVDCFKEISDHAKRCRKCEKLRRKIIVSVS